MGLRESEVVGDTMTSSGIEFETNRGKGDLRIWNRSANAPALKNLSCDGGGVNMKLRGYIYLIHPLFFQTEVFAVLRFFFLSIRATASILRICTADSPPEVVSQSVPGFASQKGQTMLTGLVASSSGILIFDLAMK